MYYTPLARPALHLHSWRGHLAHLFKTHLADAFAKPDTAMTTPLRQSKLLADRLRVTGNSLDQAKH